MSYKIAALVPAHNEKLVIEKTLVSLLGQTVPVDVFVVDDGSTDNTVDIALRFTNNVLALKQNVGKADALNTAIAHFKLASDYDFVLFMDSDTQPNPDFVELCIKRFETEGGEDIDCVVGRVQGMGGNWISNYRLWEYTVAHSIHKSAQADTKSILVVPGCATMYRSVIFKRLVIPSGTLTEDMDFTFLMHRLGYSNMAFEPNAVVYTQDPSTMRDFIKQMNRWYTGFWQAVVKHNVPWGGHNLDFEVALLATEGLFSGLSTLVVLFLLPFFLFKHSFGTFLIPAEIDLFVFFLPTLFFAAYKTGKWSLPLYFPLFYVLRFLTSILFLKGFFAATWNRNQAYTWNTARYALK